MYIPILKAKRGELTALAQIESSLYGESIIPLIEVLSEKHRDTLLANKSKLPSVFYLDVKDPEIRNVLYSDEELQSRFIEVANLAYGQIPSITVERELCVRIPSEMQDFSYLRSIANKNIVHIVIDYRDKCCVNFEPIRLFQTDIPNFNKLFFNENHDRYQWKSVTVAGSSFPQTMNKIKKGPSFFIRNEFSVLYKSFKTNFPFINYGDYTVSHPDLVENVREGDNPPHMVAKMKYTTDNGFYIIKGRDVYTSQASGRAQNHYYSDLPWGYKQFPYLAQKLCSSEYFFSDDFSWGDKNINKKASDITEGPGNPENWISYWTNHHIAVVLNQLSNQILP